jgi:pimeloyl-ACP methyl ester carboxylesterase
MLAWQGRTTIVLLISLSLLLASLKFTRAESPTRKRLEIEGGACPCYQSHPLSERHEQVTRAIVVIHGAARNAEEYFDHTVEVARLAGEESTTAVFAPHFQTRADSPRAGEYLWSASGWKQGDESLNEALHGRVSSFAVVAQLLEQLRSREAYPNLQQVAVIGHSAGGQFVNRFVAATRLESNEVAVVMNPSSYLYVDQRRCTPEGAFDRPTAPPPDYNRYRYGLDDCNQAVQQVGIERARENLFHNRVYYFAGSLDVESADLDCSRGAMLQGQHRLDRWQTYQRYVQLFPAWRENARFDLVPGVGHSGREMILSAAAREVLFPATESLLAAGEPTATLPDADDAQEFVAREFAEEAAESSIEESAAVGDDEMES